jgi:hypothetical protein
MTLKSTLKATIATGALALGLLGASAVAQAADLRCDSRVGHSNYCRVSTAGGVTLRYQHSRFRCDQNDTWGYDRGGIWVANGCSATFRVGRDRDGGGDDAAAIGLGILALGILGAVASNDDDNRDDYPPPSSGGPYPPGGGYDDDDDYGDPYAGATIISCDSKKYKFRYCAVRVDEYAELIRQRSQNACRFNKTWGFDRNGVWVKKGCRADFAVY